MDERIIVKPTDYVVGEDGMVGYSYDYESQYEDGERLNELPKDALIDECKRRWREVEELPVPSNISKYRMAHDLALAKGYDLSNHTESERNNENELGQSQREF